MSALKSRALSLASRCLARLPHRRSSHLISLLSDQLSIERISIRGKYGIITGSPRDRAILLQYSATGTWAENTNRLITSFFKNGGGTYFDIGANIGMTTIPVSGNFEVDCYSFEPDPENFRFLEINVGENCRGANVRLFPLALSNFDGEIELEKSHNNFGDHRVRPAGAKSIGQRNVVNVRCSRLDSLPIQIKSPLFVKVDVQGAEPLVLSGGSETLGRADAMLMEWSPHQMHMMGTDAIAAISFLRKTFSRGVINDNPEYLGWDSLSERPIAEVCDVISEKARALRDDTLQYFDLLLKR